MLRRITMLVAFAAPLLAALGYRINDGVSAELGYRYLKEDYDNTPTLAFDAEMHGPILGVSINW